MNKFTYLRYGDRLIFLNGKDPLRYVDLTTGEMVKYKSPSKFIYKVKSLVRPKNDA